ncbi:hypothetical protein CEUSTIGMA_g6446.t1 [Chlamydomonas eustigma]|uniref:AAA+ ATPase domain-containing protein n=1 Tax=Chlamydomonas eustigma TaxID=1157962 RepID=A0A250X7H8_9CHLO|nr:hypothetical protein CEUSTIGMA_g6446.t1 [Chlamydomonas eustigma]|eukprot:GAX79006.1 hypothetical protein CEUSTIGMA_g6446.t1 [Chlamydomonas eustigma]
MDDFITLRQLQGCLGGEECLTAVVTHTLSSSSSASTPPASLPSTQHWVLLPPEAMLKARLTAGAYVMVALTRSPSIDDNSSHGAQGIGLPASSGRLLSPAAQQVAAQPGSRRKKQDVVASHGGSTASSVNSHVASPQQQPQIHNSVAVTTSFSTASGPALNPDSCLIQGLLQLQQQQQQESPCTADDKTNVLLPDIGQYVVCAAAWPGGSKMSRGTIALSPSVNDMMLCCEVAPSSSSSSTKVPLEGRTVAVFGVGSGTSGTPNSKGMIMSETTVPEPCMELVLEACTASETMSPVRGAAGGQAALSLSSPTPAIQGSSGGGGNKGGSSSPAAQQQHHINSSGSGVRPSTAAGRQAAAGAGRSWPLRLLSRLTSSTSSSSTSSLAPLSAAQRALISNIMLKHLDGQVLLPGNPVPIPLLGVTLLCRCLLTTATGSTALCTAPASGATSSLSSSPSPASNHKTVVIRAVKIQAGLTKLTLLLPGEQCDLILGSPGGLSSSLSSRSGATGQESYFASRSDKLSSQQVQVQIAAVKAAAERAVGGSGVEAAQAAAERSFLAGLAATSSLTGRAPVGHQEGMSSPKVPSGGFNTLGGVSNHVQALRQLVTLPLRAPHLFNAYRIRPPRGVLLWGPPGSGKTMLARAAASDAGATLFLINGPDIVSEYCGESEAGLRGVFAAARALAPSVIFIDEVDALAPARGGGGGLSTAAGGGSSGGEAGSMAGRIVTVLLTLMDGVTPAGTTGSTGSTVSGDGVVVLAATNRPDALDSALRRPGRFERELEIGVPGPTARLDILKSRLQNIKHQLTESEIKALADAAHGFVGADLAQLVDEATLSALRRVIAGRGGMNKSSLDNVSESSPEEKLPESQQVLCVQLKDFREAETRVRPSAMREVAVEVPKVHWNDVGGLEDVKERLKEVVEWPSRHPDALSRLGVSPPRGLLLYGPPGCSKTLLARAVATEAGLNFFSIKGGELFSKYVGESEKAVASLFVRARATAPSVVFFDEIDALAASRSQPGGAGSSSSSSGDRVLTQLLMELDGLQARTHVIVLAATNRPDCVDAALLRPGRFDRLLYVPPPNKEGRASILRVHLRGTPLDQDVDIAQLAECTADMTGADLSALCREASLAALEEDIGCEQVSMHHFTAALRLLTSSSVASEEVLRIYERFKAPGQL